VPFRVVGISQSKMNPNICTICERAFTRVQRRKHIATQATILFADMRGYTALSERIGAVELAEIVALFHDQCARRIWAEDGIVNKQMGDGLMALFNFPIHVTDHVGAAIRAALEVQRQCGAALTELATRRGLDVVLGIGIGIHSGSVEIGEFSTDRSDFTAIGKVVNLAARLESQAAGGEVLVSASAAALASHDIQSSPTRELNLKGLHQPVTVHVLTAPVSPGKP
jgi:adenylate cyclase